VRDAEGVCDGQVLGEAVLADTGTAPDDHLCLMAAPAWVEALIRWCTTLGVAVDWMPAGTYRVYGIRVEIVQAMTH
jgi:hypothetical protein